MSFWSRRKADEDPRDARIRELEEENDALVAVAEKMQQSAKREHERQQRRIDALVQFKHELETQLDAKVAFIRSLNEAYDKKQAELDKAMAEVKRLDGKLLQVDCENLRLNGQLATAEERLAGYEKAAA